MFQLTPLAPAMAFSSSSIAASKTVGNTAFAAAQNNYNRHIQSRLSKSSSALHAIREATFGMGCFWEPAESLLKQPGILATTVGYMGNAAAKNKPPPSYDTVCFGNDYVEAVRVAYDDDILPYPQLLDLFFELQKPGNNRQYASVIFVEDSSNGKTTSNFKSGSSNSDDEQLAIQWKNESMQTKVKRSDNLPYSYVEIEPMQTSFFRAEEYHQRYWEKQRLRALVGVALIAGSSGAYDNVVPFSTSMNVVGLGNVDLDTVCNAAFLVGAGWMILERLVTNGYVRELKSGDFVKMLQ